MSYDAVKKSVPVVGVVELVDGAGSLDDLLHDRKLITREDERMKRWMFFR